MKKLIVFLLLTIPNGVKAFDFAIKNSDDITIYYDRVNESESNLSVVRGEIQYAGDVIIPSTVTIDDLTYTVTMIGEQAFMGCQELVSITMPETVCEVGVQAFDNDYNLEEISFSQNITSIRESAFSGCSKLTRVILPPKLTHLAPKTFQNCTELEVLIIPPSVQTIDNGNYNANNPFGGCSKLRKIVVDNLDSWLNLSFYGDTQPFNDYHLYVGEQELKDLVIPSHINSLKKYAFQNCTGLESITIPEHVTSIGSSAFAGIGTVKKLTVASGMLSLGRYALSGCYPEIIEVPSMDIWMNTISKNIMDNGSTIFQYQLIIDGNVVEDLCIPEGITSVDERAFCGCTSIKTVSFPYTTTSVGYLSFGYCSELETVNIRNGITFIGESAFSSCTKLKEVSLPNSISEISPFCFSGCTSLKSIVIPEGVTRIRGGAFWGCTSLENVKIPNTVTVIGSEYESSNDFKTIRVFYNCTNLKSIEIPNSVEHLTSFCFYGCSSLSSVKLSDNLEYISDRCFAECTNLKYLTIGSGTKSMSYGAFSGCTSLEEITCKSLEPPTVQTQGWSSYIPTFNNVNFNNIGLHVPASAIETYQTTTPWMNFKAVSSIADNTNDERPKCATPTIRMNAGKLDFNCETEDVEFNYTIINSDNVKGKGNHVSLTQTTRIIVYASKKGYEDSNNASLELHIGDVDGNGVVNVADHVELSKIILNQK